MRSLKEEEKAEEDILSIRNGEFDEVVRLGKDEITIPCLLRTQDDLSPPLPPLQDSV